MASVTAALLSGTTLPKASTTCTVTAGVSAWPATPVAGCCAKRTALAAPAVMLKAADSACVSPLLVTRRV
jgi:hypothetical protein